jgi:hypothetical protein
MKLKELTGYKGNAHYQAAKNTLVRDNPEDENRKQFNKFKEYMVANGFEYMGTGAYGTVYEKPGYPWLFKLFKEDPAYIEFIQYSKAHADNPHLPKFKGGIIRINADTYCIRTEKLVDLPYENYRKYMDYFTAVFAVLQNRVDKNDSMYDELYREYQQFSRKHPNIYEILKYIFTESSYHPDLHNGNLMMRGSTLVFSDPVAI